jgi:hypothetical protein
MPFWIRLGVTLAACTVLNAQQLPEDPVMKVRALRAQAQGIKEADLPPVPRGVTDPPPLPPPEAHLKDARHGHGAKVAVKRGGKLRHGRKSAETEPAEAAPRVVRAHKAGKSSRTAKPKAPAGHKARKRNH